MPPVLLNGNTSIYQIDAIQLTDNNWSTHAVTGFNRWYADINGVVTCERITILQLQ